MEREIYIRIGPLVFYRNGGWHRPFTDCLSAVGWWSRSRSHHRKNHRECKMIQRSFILLCLWILQAFERQCDRSIWQSARIFPGYYVPLSSPKKTPIVLSLFRRAPPLKSQLHRADSLACTDLCLCGAVAYQSFQRSSSRLQYGLPTWKVLVWSETRMLKARRTNGLILIIPLSRSRLPTTPHVDP